MSHEFDNNMQIMAETYNGHMLFRNSENGRFMSPESVADVWQSIIDNSQEQAAKAEREALFEKVAIASEQYPDRPDLVIQETGLTNAKIQKLGYLRLTDVQAEAKPFWETKKAEQAAAQKLADHKAANDAKEAKHQAWVAELDEYRAIKNQQEALAKLSLNDIKNMTVSELSQLTGVKQSEIHNKGKASLLSVVAQAKQAVEQRRQAEAKDNVYPISRDISGEQRTKELANLLREHDQAGLKSAATRLESILNAKKTPQTAPAVEPVDNVIEPQPVVPSSVHLTDGWTDDDIRESASFLLTPAQLERQKLLFRVDDLRRRREARQQSQLRIDNLKRQREAGQKSQHDEVLVPDAVMAPQFNSLNDLFGPWQADADSAADDDFDVPSFLRPDASVSSPVQAAQLDHDLRHSVFWTDGSTADDLWGHDPVDPGNSEPAPLAAQQPGATQNTTRSQNQAPAAAVVVPQPTNPNQKHGWSLRKKALAVGAAALAVLGLGIGAKKLLDSHTDHSDKTELSTTSTVGTESTTVSTPKPTSSETTTTPEQTTTTPEQTTTQKPQSDNISIDNWTWDVAHNLKPGNEILLIQKGIDAYNQVHGTDFALRPIDHIQYIVNGSGRIISPKEMQELNLRIIDAA